MGCVLTDYEHNLFTESQDAKTLAQRLLSVGGESGCYTSVITEIDNSMMLPTFTPKTALGKRLFEIRRMIVESGEKLLNKQELEQEMQERRQ